MAGVVVAFSPALAALVHPRPPLTVVLAALPTALVGQCPAVVPVLAAAGGGGLLAAILLALVALEVGLFS
jgi:hypothetical protein